MYTQKWYRLYNTTRITTIRSRSNFTQGLKNRNMENAIIHFSIERLKMLQRDLNQSVISNFTKYHEENALTITDYILSMKSEINPADNYRRDNILLLARFSIFHHNKALKHIIREDVLSFLDSLRKTEGADPLHKWIGTYNLFRIYLLRFFKWLYYSDVEPDKRSKPAIMENILQLKRKENQSTSLLTCGLLRTIFYS